MTLDIALKKAVFFIIKFSISTFNPIKIGTSRNV